MLQAVEMKCMWYFPQISWGREQVFLPTYMFLKLQIVKLTANMTNTHLNICTLQTLQTLQNRYREGKYVSDCLEVKININKFADLRAQVANRINTEV